MGDLDDFFAKKDKNRKKKSKGISNEDFVQKYEQKCRDNLDVERKSVEILNNLSSFIQDDGEWNDFADEQKDYSGLKIHDMHFDDEEQDKEEEDLPKETIETPWSKKDKEEELNEDDVEPDGDDDEDKDDKEAGDKKDDDNSKKEDSSEPSSTTADPAEDDNPLAAIAKQLAMMKLKRETEPESASSLKLAAPAPKIDDQEEFPDLGFAPPEPEPKPQPAPSTTSQQKNQTSQQHQPKETIGFSSLLSAITANANANRVNNPPTPSNNSAKR